MDSGKSFRIHAADRFLAALPALIVLVGTSFFVILVGAYTKPYLFKTLDRRDEKSGASIQQYMWVNPGPGSLTDVYLNLDFEEPLERSALKEVPCPGLKGEMQGDSRLVYFPQCANRGMRSGQWLSVALIANFASPRLPLEKDATLIYYGGKVPVTREPIETFFGWGEVTWVSVAFMAIAALVLALVWPCVIRKRFAQEAEVYVRLLNKTYQAIGEVPPANVEEAKRRLARIENAPGPAANRPRTRPGSSPA